MSRPMRFPSRGRRVLLLLFGIALGPLLLALPATGWLVWTLSPLQKFYLGTYAASSLGSGQPGSVTSIRWALKTAPRRKSVPMIPQDAVAGPDQKLPVSLSDQALADGWRGVALSPPEKVSSSELAPLLQDSIYEGESIPRILGMPLLYGLAGLIFLCIALQKVKDAWGYGLSSWAQRRQEERHGRRTKGPELSLPSVKMFRRDSGIRLRLQGESLGSKLLPWGRSYAIPKRLESSHIMLMGDTGSGKSSAIRQILRQVKERGDSAIVYDPAMDFVGEFYSPERGDLILNPLDARFPYWSLPEEILNDEIATSIAAALVPEKEYEKAFFTDAPRRVLAHLLRKKPEVRDLLRWMSDPEEIALRGREERIDAIAKEYAKSPESTLVVSPDNRSRAEINERIHAELQRHGVVGKEEHSVQTLVPRQDLTGAARTWAERYEIGEVLRYSRGSKETGIGKGEYARVVCIDAPHNRITVELKDGTERTPRLITYDPHRQQGVSVYREEPRSFSQGDRIQFTAPANDLKVANRELGTIESIIEGRMSLRMDDGSPVQLDPARHPHLDHGYAVTSHSSQGQTAERVLVHVDTELGAKDLLNNRMAYVAISRGAHDAQLFTNDREKLPAALGHEVTRESAHTPQHKQERSIQPPQQEIAPKHEHSHGLGLSL